MKAAPIGTMAVASAVAAANIYYNQPMLADMARSLHVDEHYAGFVATATQAGYALGMPLFIPLGDLFERRALVVTLFGAVAVSMLIAASSSSLAVLIAGSFCIGLTSVIAQILIPLASDLSPPGSAGKTIGLMQSGLLLGIVLARTVSGIVAHHFGWRAMFYTAAVIAIVFSVVLRTVLPPVPAKAGVLYADVMRSLWRLIVDNRKLRQICSNAALFFAAFSAFWTTLVFLLERPPYHYGSQTAGLFGLVGAVGAGAAPLSGYWSDRKGSLFVVALSIAIVVASFGIFWVFGLHLIGLVLGVIVLDAGVQAAQVANQSEVMSIQPDARNRLNSVYMVSYFAGGSLGSIAGSYLWSIWGWAGVCATGIACMALAAEVLRARYYVST